MSIETPRQPDINTSSNIKTPSAQETRLAVNPDHKESFSQKYLNTRLRKWGAGVAIAASVLGGVGVAVGEIARSHNVEVQLDNTNKEPQKIEDIIPFNFTDSKQYEALDWDHQREMDHLNLMSLEDFQQLSSGDQFKFNTLQYDRYEPWALKEAKNAGYKDNKLAIDTIPIITKNSSGQDIVNDSAIKRCVQWWSLAKQSRAPGKLTEQGSSDRTNAAKLESLRATVGSWVYNTDSKNLMTDLAFDNTVACSADIVVTKESPAVTIGNEITKVVQGVDVTGKTIQQTYVYAELEDYKGQKRPNWTLSDTGTETSSKVWYNDPAALK